MNIHMTDRPARPPRPNPADTLSLVRALRAALALKDVRRAGWVQRGVAGPESVADHSWGLTLLALTLTPPELDLGRVLAIAAVHDLAEVEVGDITPADNVSKAEKSRRERAAIETLLADLPPERGAELHARWLDYEDGRTPEGRFVKELDALEMVFQAAAYTAPARPDLSHEFADSARARITTPHLATLLETVVTDATNPAAGGST